MGAWYNRRYTITLTQDIQSEDGDTLASIVKYYFTSKYKPLYTSSLIVRSKIGPFLLDVPEDTINLAIYRESLDFHTRFPCIVSKYGVDEYGVLATVPRAVQAYVAARVQYELLSTVVLEGARSVGSKLLGDFRVDKAFGVQAVLARIQPAADRATEAIEYWENKVGELCEGTTKGPKVAVKGAIYNTNSEAPINRNWSFR